MIKPEEKAALTADITAAFDEMISLISSFNADTLNRVPYEGSWTAGQVVDHILIGASNLPDQMTKQADRRYDLHVKTLETIFLDFDHKLHHPDFLTPGPGPFDGQALVEKLQAAKSNHLDAIENKDLTQICLDFEMPTIGFLTRYEFLRFYVAHVKRHNHQLEKISKALAA
jgi:hypothetical protein